MHLAFALVAVVTLLSVPANAANPERVGSLVEVPLPATEKKVEAGVGDVLCFEISYPVVPDKMVSDLKVEIKGEGLTHVATVRAPNRAANGQVVVGTAKIAALVRADKSGEMAVTIVPRLGKSNGEKIELKVKVAEK